MCGICGFTGRRDPALLRAMAASIRHRGPDDDGFFETDGASLGFRRLAIIDLDTGAQPMSTDGDRLHIVFNGEIYNYRELRTELEAEGRRFSTRSDTEVALQAYAQWGAAAFQRFNGMWAIALLDRRGAETELVLCRDHFGIKPLFYAAHDERVVFASEIKAILEDPTFPRRVDEQQLYEYLRFGLYDHNDLTFFSGIRQVAAGAYVTVDPAGGTRETRYWTPRLSEDADPDPKEFLRLFTRAVERRLVADVPVGTCLSGGLDSSSIVCVMDRLLAQHVPELGLAGRPSQDLLGGLPRRPHRRAALRRGGAGGHLRRPDLGAADLGAVARRAGDLGLARRGADDHHRALRDVVGDARRQ